MYHMIVCVCIYMYVCTYTHNIMCISIFYSSNCYSCCFSLVECVLGEERFYILTPIDIIIAEVSRTVILTTLCMYFPTLYKILRKCA